MKYFYLLGCFLNMFSAILIAKIHPVISGLHFLFGLFLGIYFLMEMNIGEE